MRKLRSKGFKATDLVQFPVSAPLVMKLRHLELKSSLKKQVVFCLISNLCVRLPCLEHHVLWHLFHLVHSTHSLSFHNPFLTPRLGQETPGFLGLLVLFPSEPLLVGAAPHPPPCTSLSREPITHLGMPSCSWHGPDPVNVYRRENYQLS